MPPKKTGSYRRNDHRDRRRDEGLDGWKRVKAPKPWRGREGEEITGKYLGSKTKDGQFGQYTVHFIEQRSGNIAYVSGTTVNDLFAIVPTGSKVKLVFLGMKVSQNTGNEYKAYELYTSEHVEFKIFDEEPA